MRDSFKEIHSIRYKASKVNFCIMDPRHRLGCIEVFLECLLKVLYVQKLSRFRGLFAKIFFLILSMEVTKILEEQTNEVEKKDN